MPSPSRGVPTFDPVAERAQIQKRRIAAQRAKDGDRTGRFAPPVGSTRRAQLAEAQLGDEQRAAAEEYRRRMATAATPLSSFSPAEFEEPDPGDDDAETAAVEENYAMQMGMLEAQARQTQQMEQLNRIRAQMAAAQQAKTAALQQAKNDDEPIVNVNRIIGYSMQGLGVIGMPGEDFGVSYTTGTTGSIYQFFMSLAKFAGFKFPYELEKLVPVLPEAPGPDNGVKGTFQFILILVLLFWIPVLISMAIVLFMALAKLAAPEAFINLMTSTIGNIF